MYLLALMVISMGVASVVCRFLIREGQGHSTAVSALSAVSVGWLMGTLLICVYSFWFPGQSNPLSACVLSVVSLLFVFFYLWRSLSASSTDDLIGLVAVVNASALAAISLPYLFILLACCAPNALPTESVDHEDADPEQGEVVS